MWVLIRRMLIDVSNLFSVMGCFQKPRKPFSIFRAITRFIFNKSYTSNFSWIAIWTLNSWLLTFYNTESIFWKLWILKCVNDYFWTNSCTLKMVCECTLCKIMIIGCLCYPRCKIMQMHSTPHWFFVWKLSSVHLKSKFNIF